MLQPKVGQTVLVLVEPTALPEPAGEMTARSKDFGEAFRKWSHRDQNTSRRYSLA